MALATAAQKKYINKLIADWELTDEQTAKVLAHIGATSMETLTKGDAPSKALSGTSSAPKIT